MALIGLTGGIGSGKSTVAQMLRDRRIPVVDCDQIARDQFEPGQATYWKVRQTFGDEILQEDGKRIDRAKLAAIIFTDESKRKVLNQITHPAIYNQVFQQVLYHWLCQQALIFIELPLLYESGYMLPYVSRVVVVGCERNTQIERIVMRNQFSTEQAEQRVAAQWPLEEKCKRADFVITNETDLKSLQAQLDNVLKCLKAQKVHWKPRFIFDAILMGSLSGIVLATFRLLKWLQWL